MDLINPLFTSFLANLCYIQYIGCAFMAFSCFFLYFGGRDDTEEGASFVYTLLVFDGNCINVNVNKIRNLN